MRKRVIAGSIVIIAALIVAFTLPGREKIKTAATDEAKIKWYSWEEAIAANKRKPKKFFIDVYTDWCGWCKKMDATTFADPEVAAFMNEHFYAVKLDAEQKENIVYDGRTFKYIAAGSRGVHELAYALLDGQLGYPSYVYLNEQRERITVSPGYKPVEGLMKELHYISGDHYKTIRIEDYRE